jgi:hypothetical protein
MLNNITLETACEIIYDFSNANSVDALTGVELMVKYFKQLSQVERKALVMFMDETAKS